MNRILAILFCCVAISFTTKEEPPNKFSDEIFVKIADYQDRRQSDSLFQFFNHESPAYRRDAVLAFGSIQDASAVEKIGVLLNDKNAEVRKAAAFALGQIGGERAFSFLYNTPEDTLAIDEILEASGKTAGQASSLPVDISSWGLYRLALRGLADSTAIVKAIECLNPNFDENVRLGAAHFFARGPQDISGAEEILVRTVQADKSVFVRMAATAALRKIKTPTSLQAILKILNSDADYRVRVNSVRALQSFSVEETKQPLFRVVQDSNVQVAITASEVIKAVATKNEYKELVSLARSATNWRVQGNLYEAVLATSNNKEIAEEVFKLYDTVENPYAKAALLTALGQSTLAYSFISEQLSNASIPVIKSSAAGALVSINQHKEFDSELQKRFVDLYKKALESGDAAVMGTIAFALGDSALGYKRIIKDYNFLYEAKNKLTLPKDNEALQPLEAAIAHFEGKKISAEVKNEFNHPIDWGLVKTIPKDQKVLIKTVKGDIVIQLLVEEAPGSVANFVQLVNSQYFNAKNFHRVVPNFVIQGGCNRGDGWGSEDYSIRSEFSMRRYTEGSVGMASAGKDTEGTQWFITHSPTPHLDGRYTIFAIVTEGMNVVHSMEVGDSIISVELVK
jgi:cyclophilin family peptidyl-prolyl cis-trans isomerase/HEAT repeat protein